MILRICSRVVGAVACALSFSILLLGLSPLASVADDMANGGDFAPAPAENVVETLITSVQTELPGGDEVCRCPDPCGKPPAIDPCEEAETEEECKVRVCAPKGLPDGAPIKECLWGQEEECNCSIAASRLDSVQGVTPLGESFCSIGSSVGLCGKKGVCKINITTTLSSWSSPATICKITEPGKEPSSYEPCNVAAPITVNSRTMTPQPCS